MISTVSDDRADQPLAPDEPHALGELREVPTVSRSRSRSSVGTRDEESHEGGRDEEAAGVEPQRRGGAEDCDEEAAERPADQDRGLLDRAPDARCPLHADTGELHDIGKERRAGGCARRVEQRAEEHERHQLPQLDPDGRVQQGDRRDTGRAREIGDDARRSEAEPIDDDAAEEPGEDDGQEVEEDREPGQSRAAGRDEHVPGDRELRDGVPGERDRVRGVQGVERRAPHGATRLIGQAGRRAAGTAPRAPSA